MKKSIYLITTILATVIGAGFATGQEIYTFFNRYGKMSFGGLFPAVAVLFFAFYVIFKLCHAYKIDSFVGFIQRFLPKRMAYMVSAAAGLFSFCGLCAMASATGALASESLGISYMGGVVITLVLCGLVVAFGLTAVARVNLFLAPVICIGLAYYAIYGYVFRSVETILVHYYTDGMQIGLSALIYASYNVLSVAGVLCSMRAYCDNVRQIRRACINACSILLAVMVCIWLVIEVYADKILLGEIPMLTIAARGGRVHEIVYATLLLASVFTTAIGCGFTSVAFLSQHTRLGRGSSTLFICIAVLPVCSLGFSGIVRVIYTFFGYLGLPFLIILLCLYIKTKMKAEIRQK